MSILEVLALFWYHNEHIFFLPVFPQSLSVNFCHVNLFFTHLLYSLAFIKSRLLMFFYVAYVFEMSANFFLGFQLDALCNSV